MPQFELVPLDEAIIRCNLTGRRGQVIKEYLDYIGRLEEGQAGKLVVSEGETPGAVRRRLGAAAKLANKALVIKRVGDEIYFWLESDEAARQGRRRGRRRRATGSSG